jgi:DNA-binding CsgD family transcriptional regulator
MTAPVAERGSARQRGSIRLMGFPALIPRLVGRDAEIRALGEALDRVSSGHPTIVLVEGEAGIGKTRLLEHALAKARARGMQVVAGRAEELERTRPFGLLAATFGCATSSRDPRLAAIGALLATHGAGDRGPITVTSDPGLLFRTVDAFTDLVDELALAGPLVIGVDDLQWADPSSLLTLGAVGRRLAYVPVAVIGCLRPAPRAAELEQLAGALETAGARHLALSPLRDDAVHDLVADTVAAEPGPGLLAEVSGAAGNPLFITELIGAIFQEGAVKTAGGLAEVTETTLPPTLRLTILRRLSFLPAETLQALRAASILGSGFSLTDLATVTGSSALGLAEALAEAIRARVIEDDGTRLRFRHDLIRDSLYEDLPESVRRGLHREAGQRLAQAGAPALRVAGHLAKGATRGDAQAIAWLTRGAREAAAASPIVAADLLERAIALMDPADPGRDQSLAERASSLVRAGRVSDAEEICRALLGRAHDPGADAPAQLCLGQALLAGGRPRDALRELELVVKSPAHSATQRASALGSASIAHMWLGDLDRTCTAAEQARAAATAGDHLTTSVALSSLAIAAELRGRLQHALQLIDDAVRLADQNPARLGHGWPVHAHRAFILIHLDRLNEARSTLHTGRQTSESLGIGWDQPSYQAVRAVERFISGEWDDAIAEIQAGAEMAAETGQTQMLTAGLSVLSLISLHRNDLDRAETTAHAAMSQAGEIRSTSRVWATWAHALVQEAGGKIGEALGTLAGSWDMCASTGFRVEYRVIGADLVRLALAAGDTGRAHEVAVHVAELAHDNQVPSLAGAALHCRGLADNDPQVLELSVTAYAQSPRPLELARASEDAGTAFAQRGNADRSRPLIEHALEIYERFGAARDLARAEAVLRDAGIRRGRRGPRSRPQFGWQSLTPTEQSVAGLVAEGLSNPQIGDRLYVSRRAVQAHLAHIFAKLDLTSRAQLAAEVIRRTAIH